MGFRVQIGNNLEHAACFHGPLLSEPWFLLSRERFAVPPSRLQGYERRARTVTDLAATPDSAKPDTNNGPPSAQQSDRGSVPPDAADRPSFGDVQDDEFFAQGDLGVYPGGPANPDADADEVTSPALRMSSAELQAVGQRRARYRKFVASAVAACGAFAALAVLTSPGASGTDSPAPAVGATAPPAAVASADTASGPSVDQPTLAPRQEAAPKPALSVSEPPPELESPAGESAVPEAPSPPEVAEPPVRASADLVEAAEPSRTGSSPPAEPAAPASPPAPAEKTRLSPAEDQPAPTAPAPTTAKTPPKDSTQALPAQEAKVAPPQAPVAPQRPAVKPAPKPAAPPKPVAAPEPPPSQPKKPPSASFPVQ